MGICKRIMLILVIIVGLAIIMSTQKIVNVEKVEIESYVVLEELETVVTESLYGGETELVTFFNEPSEGMSFLLLDVNIEIKEGEKINLDNIYMYVNGKKYKRIKNDIFLSEHGYDYLKHDYSSIDVRGWICFEIPKIIDEDNLKLTAELEIGGLVSIVEEKVIDFRITQEQFKGYSSNNNKLNVEYLEELKKVKYTPQNPYIIVNPYEIAPLSALICFETEEYSTITTIIEGRGNTEKAIDLTTITNIVEEKNILHQIPLIGLYEGENNVKVIIQTEDLVETHTYKVKTESLPEGLKDKIRVTHQNLENVSEGLYQIKNDNRILIDVNGDIRGWFTISTGGSSVDEITENGHIILSENCYEDDRTLYEVDYMGNMYKEIDISNIEVHHDILQLENNTYFTYDTILDLENYEIIKNINWSEYFNKEHGSFQVRNFGDKSDWQHFNTIAYAGENSIFVSMRNQHAVAKLSYPDMEIEWILSPNEEASPENKDKMLKPIGENFEWFYSQHDARLVSDNGNGIIDITIFDNGVQRGMEGTVDDYPIEDMYSRMVHYRIDENNMTVEQIWDWGKEFGTEGISSIHGSTMYIEEDGLYLGNFDTISNNVHVGSNSIPEGLISPSKVLAVNKNGEIILGFEMDISTYRAEKVDIETLYSAWEGIGSVNSEYAYMSQNSVIKYNNWYEIKEETVDYQIQNIEATENYLNISGWAAVQEDLDKIIKRHAMILTNTETGDEYWYSNRVDYSKTKQSTVPEEVKNQLHETAGFTAAHLNLNGLIEGEYTIKLIVSDGYTYNSVVVDYTLLIGDIKNEIEKVISDDILEYQAKISKNIVRDYSEGDYTLLNPFTIIDPYSIAPLSAVTLFETKEPAYITLEVSGLNGGETLTKIFEEIKTEHQIPIYGLYEEKFTKVTLTANYVNGTSESKVLELSGNKLPETFIQSTVTKEISEEMEEGLTFYSVVDFTGNGYIHAIDSNGDVRWAITKYNLGNMGFLNQLENGNYLISSEKSTGNLYYVDSMYEFDLTGKIYTEYIHNGIHHDAIEIENGNLIVVGNDISGEVVEDTIYELDRSTGEIINLWDMDYYFPVPNLDENGNRVSDVNYGSDSHDWIHINSISYNKNTNQLLISGRNQDVIICLNLNTNNVDFIISDHNDMWTKEIEKKLLTPTSLEFEWSYGQHNVQWLENGDILVFDNGNFRSKTKDEIIDVTEGYSRAVIYRVSEKNMTIEQIWQYGKTLGIEGLSAFVGSVQYIAENHVLINFGGMVRDEEGNPSYDSADGYNGQSYTLVQEVKDGNIVFESKVSGEFYSGNTYRVQRINPYDNVSQLNLEIEPKRIGKLIMQEEAIEVDKLPNSKLFNVAEAEIKDNGVQLVPNIKLPGAVASDENKLYFVSDKVYELKMESGNEITTPISKELIPIGNYHIYIMSGDELANLRISWTNTAVGIEQKEIEKLKKE